MPSEYGDGETQKEDVECAWELEDAGVSQCRSCQTAGCRCNAKCDAAGCPGAVEQKRIWRQVRAASSSYMGALASLTVHGSASNRPRRRWSMVNWNQRSDRAVPHTGTAYNPSRGNSTRATLVRHRPGAGGFAGVGVDVKHGSYARYLNRLKAKSIATQPSSCSKGVRPKYGNKRRNIGMLADPRGLCCIPGGLTNRDDGCPAPHNLTAR